MSVSNYIFSPSWKTFNMKRASWLLKKPWKHLFAWNYVLWNRLMQRMCAHSQLGIRCDRSFVLSWARKLIEDRSTLNVCHAKWMYKDVSAFCPHHLRNWGRSWGGARKSPPPLARNAGWGQSHMLSGESLVPKSVFWEKFHPKSNCPLH